MKTLILLRHAKSDWSQYVSDHDRPLNTRGRTDAPKMGKWIAERTIPDIVLCSPSQRTRETYALTSLEAPIIYHEKLYHASSETMLSQVEALSADIKIAMVIGHNPGMAFFAEDLLAINNMPDDYVRFPTCACAIITFDIKHWKEIDFHNGHLQDFAIPGDLA